MAVSAALTMIAVSPKKMNTTEEPYAGVRPIQIEVLQDTSSAAIHLRGWMHAVSTGTSA